jgi:7-cyano-7-deazaguanine synthase
MERTKSQNEEYESDIEWLEEKLLKKRGYVFKIPHDEDVIFLMSGGLDSTVAVDMVIKEWNVKIFPLFFRRGQAAQELEEKAFDFFVDFYKKRYPNNIVITEEELMKITCNIPMKRAKECFPIKRVQEVGYPGRNCKMWEFAVDTAIALNNKYGSNIRTILVGSVDEDKYTPESGLRSLRSFMVHKCMNLDEWHWQITSPLTDPIVQEIPLNKVHLIKHAVDNGIPLEKTRSCFGSSHLADGTCAACKYRKTAFKYLGIKDQIAYKETIGQVLKNE